MTVNRRLAVPQIAMSVADSVPFPRFLLIEQSMYP
jgi:hypothetical protein